MTINTAIQTDRFYPANKMEYSVPTPESMFKYARVSGEYEWLLADVPEDERAEAVERLNAQNEANKEARKEELKKERKSAMFTVSAFSLLLLTGFVLAVIFPSNLFVWLYYILVSYLSVFRIADSMKYLWRTRKSQN